MDWEVIDAKGHSTVIIKKENKRFYLHSKYDPIKEAKTWVNSFAIDSEIEIINVVGVGLGYHIEELINKYPHIHIHVFEFNYLFIKWLLDNNMLSNLMNNDQIILHYGENLSHLLNLLSRYISEGSDNLLIYKPSLELIEKEEIRLSLESFLVTSRTIREQGDSLKRNFSNNLKLNDNDISQFIGQYSNYPVILVSAGPSLSKQLPSLKVASKNGVFIACVGTALLPLIKAGIRPNLMMISDPKDAIVEQFLGFKDIDIPLFYLSTANHHAVRKYKGPRYIVWQKGFKEAEFQAELNNVLLIETGGSVATCLLDLLVTFGSKKIAIVGQDLAYTNNETHIVGSHAYRKITNIAKLIEVDDYFRKYKVKTSRNLYIYLKWFEQYVLDHKEIDFWNCTEGGAFIKGWKHRPLEEFLDKFKHSEWKC